MLNRRDVIAGSLLLPVLGEATTACASAAPDLIVRGNRLFLDMIVNGHRVRGLLDSAAESSFIDSRFARSIGVVGGESVRTRGSGGDTSSSLAKGVTIEALGLKLGPLTVAVLDLSDVGQRLLHGPLAVVLGRELFDAARFEIDIARSAIHQVPRNQEPRGARLDLHTERGTETFPASVEGCPAVPTVFDLGNGSDVLIGAAYAKEIGLLSDGRPVTMKQGGGIGGAVARQAVKLRTLDIAGHRFRNVAASLDATGSAAKLNVGVAILRQFRITVDYARHRLWLAD
jgi:predicted aspartyl protease